MGQQTVIFSVFGQIESVAADIMVQKSKACRIEPRDVPATARYNDRGEICHCALMVDRRGELEFDELVRALRA